MSESVCQECGMVTKSPAEYHPYAACLMFKGCGDGDVVRHNLAAVFTTARKDLMTEMMSEPETTNEQG